ncbi:MAG: efflux RND transporter periplasmic adaptor subunit [Flavobacteriales bacterium]|nr:efflux RND transporter periplasmic adaptor subunit [Flavobacteriales bacterium]
MMEALTKRSFLPIYISAVLLTFHSCSSKNEEKNSQSAISEKTTTVEVISPEQRSFKAEILITGTALPNQSVMLYAMESGIVQSINVNIGSLVNKGDVLALLHNPELIRLEEKYRAKLEAKTSIYDRLKTSLEFTPDLTPIQLVEEARVQYESAKAELSIIANRLNFLQVKAPFGGIITQRLVDHGALVQSGFINSDAAKIVEIQEVNPIVLTLPLPESDAASIKKGTPASVSFPELAGNSYEAKVSRTAGALDPASKTMQVEIDIDNGDHKIKSGMYAKVTMLLESQENVLSLPHTAQYLYQNELFLLVVNEGIVEQVPLRKGLSNKDYFEVLNGDISVNTKVIVQGKSLVKPGQTVEAISNK